MSEDQYDIAVNRMKQNGKEDDFQKFRFIKLHANALEFVIQCVGSSTGFLLFNSRRTNGDGER